MIEVDGIPIEEHKRVYPNRWKVKYRAWPVFWWSLAIIPLFAAYNWLTDSAWERTQTSVLVGYIVAKLFLALDPKGHESEITQKWTLDPKPSLWSRLRAKAGEA